MLLQIGRGVRIRKRSPGNFPRHPGCDLQSQHPQQQRRSPGRLLLIVRSLRRRALKVRNPGPGTLSKDVGGQSYEFGRTNWVWSCSMDRRGDVHGLLLEQVGRVQLLWEMEWMSLSVPLAVWKSEPCSYKRQRYCPRLLFGRLLCWSCTTLREVKPPARRAWTVKIPLFGRSLVQAGASSAPPPLARLRKRLQRGRAHWVRGMP